MNAATSRLALRARSISSADVTRVFHSGVRIAAPIQPPIVVRDRGDVNPGPLSASAGAIELVRTDIDQRVGVSVIRVLEDDDVFAAGMRAGQAQREFVGFAAGIHDEADAQRLRHAAGEPLRVAHYVVVQIARVGVEQRRAALARHALPWMAMADQRHIVVDVEVRAPGVVVQILHPSANDLQRLAIRNAEIARRALRAARPASHPRSARFAVDLAAGMASNKFGSGESWSTPGAATQRPHRENRCRDRASPESPGNEDAEANRRFPESSRCARISHRARSAARREDGATCRG